MLKRIDLTQWKVILLSSLGGMLDIYDFVIFAIFAKAIGAAFFPSAEVGLEMMAAFAAFAVGYLSRPLGGLIFSHFGDKYGRKKSFILSIVIMGLATVAMGLMPSYAQYGIMMPILFLLLRFVQGIAVGGEIPGAITYVAEHVPERAGFACAIIYCFMNLGVVAAHLVKLITLQLNASFAFNFSPWRIAFLIGGVLALLSYFLRTSLDESPEFLAFKHQVKKIPVVDLFQTHRKQALMSILIVAAKATMISLIFLYITSYMQLSQHYSASEVISLNLFALGTFTVATLLWGRLCDISGAKPILMTGLLLLMPTSLWFFSSLANNSHIYIAATVIGIVSALITGSFAKVLVDNFSTQVRYTGIALSYNVAFAVFGGLSPLIATLLIERSGNWLMPAYLLSAMCLVSLIGLKSNHIKPIEA